MNTTYRLVRSQHGTTVHIWLGEDIVASFYEPHTETGEAVLEYLNSKEAQP